MLEIIDTRDVGASARLGGHPAKPFALIRLHQTYGGREVVSVLDRYASREEAGVGLTAFVRNPLPASCPLKGWRAFLGLPTGYYAT
jgi:hypothetical protein